MQEKKELWWKKTGFDFTCAICGKCCGGEPGFIWTDEKERKNISEFLGVDASELRKKYLRRVDYRLSIREKENFDCIFLNDETKRCTIYPVRPEQCRDFPFWKSMLEDKEEWDFYAERCPGMNQGHHYTPEEIEEIYKKP